MTTRKASGRCRAYAVGGALLLLMGLAQPGSAQTESMTPEERDAVQLVKDWFAAWNTKDTEKVASYLSPSVLFLSYTNSPLCHGPGPIIARYKVIQALGVEVSDVKAVTVASRTGLPSGGPQPTGWSVAVLSSRIDSAIINGTRKSGTMSGFFVIANGKIQEFWEEPDRSPAGKQTQLYTCASGLQATPSK